MSAEKKVEEIKKQITLYRQHQEQAQQNFYRLDGAINLLNQQLQLIEKENEEVKRQGEENAKASGEEQERADEQTQ